MATVKNRSNGDPHVPDVRGRSYRLRRGVDKPFLAAIILLLCAGIVMVATASYVYAGSKKEFGYDNLYFFKRHVVFVIVGFITMLLVTKIPYEVIRKYTPLIFLVTLALMGLVLFMPELNGARRWIALGSFTIQPSEIMKFAVIVMCADYIDRFHSQITLKGQPGSFIHIVLPTMCLALIGVGIFALGAVGVFVKIKGGSQEFLVNGEPGSFYGLIKFCDDFMVPLLLLGTIILCFAIRMGIKRKIATEAPDFFFGVLPFGIMIGVIGVLLVLEPHMSGLIIITMIIVILMVVGGCSARYLLGAVAVGGIGMFGLLNLLPHSKSRLDIWKDPFIDMQGDGWQPAQSLYAIGNGGVWGVGIGQSRQKQLYLPEPMNDYIFAI
ncbi:MAG: FtsW/RodA/SpoVE family cell cycle protein, partial [Clostridia bacterium]|nr:FtsW/RodA/SpoVE family cell cycle protein [Clostridia bacterium]